MITLEKLQCRFEQEHSNRIKVLDEPKDNLKLVQNWIELESRSILHTHNNVDADAAFSAALMILIRERIHGKNSTHLEFLPSDFPVESESSLGVDMMNGGNSIKGIGHGSAFGELVTIATKLKAIPHRLFTSFADQLNLTDSGKPCNDRIALAGLTKSWKYAGLEDREIVSRAKEILNGMWIGKEKHYSRLKISNKIPIKNGIALNLHGGGVDRRTLSRRGALLVINHHQDIGQSIILTPKGKKAKLDLNDLTSTLPQSWFVHPTGWMACYGSLKAIKNPENSGISLPELCMITHDWISKNIEINSTVVQE